jgi:hypothetical protein
LQYFPKTFGECFSRFTDYLTGKDISYYLFFLLFVRQFLPL